MDLQDKLIYVIEVLKGESSESRPLPTLDIDLHGHMLMSQITAVDYVFQRIKLSLRCLFCFLSQTSQLKMISFVIRLTGRTITVGAVVLVVRHRIA